MNCAKGFGRKEPSVEEKYLWDCEIEGANKLKNEAWDMRMLNVSEFVIDFD